MWKKQIALPLLALLILGSGPALAQDGSDGDPGGGATGGSGATWQLIATWPFNPSATANSSANARAAAKGAVAREVSLTWALYKLLNPFNDIQVTHSGVLSTEQNDDGSYTASYSNGDIFVFRRSGGFPLYPLFPPTDTGTGG